MLDCVNGDQKETFGETKAGSWQEKIYGGDSHNQEASLKADYKEGRRRCPEKCQT